MGNGVFELNDLAVLPEWRYGGYGRKLLDFCKAKVIEMSGNKITLGIVEGNAVVKEWYTANGFTHTGTGVLPQLPFAVGLWNGGLEMPKCELTTMVMIQDVTTDKVLVQERVKSWKGYAFPGGHIEDGENLYDCAVREVFEETGLSVRNLKSCGLVHWYNNKTGDRMMIFLYKTTDFEGEVISNDEGQNFWMDVAELRAALNTGKQTNSFYVYQPLFFEDKYSEAFGSWNDDEPWEMEYR